MRIFVTAYFEQPILSRKVILTRSFILNRFA